MLSKIISDRETEIFDLANEELKKIGRDKKLPGGIVLVGGGVKLPQIDELAKKIFKLTVSIGIPGEFSNIDADPSLAVACGLVSGAWEEREGEGAETSRLPGGGIWEKVKNSSRLSSRSFSALFLRQNTSGICPGIVYSKTDSGTSSWVPRR